MICSSNVYNEYKVLVLFVQNQITALFFTRMDDRSFTLIDADKYCKSNLLQCSDYLFALFKLQQKQPSIQSRDHHVPSSESIFLPVLWSHANSSSFPSRRNLLHGVLSFDCWSAVIKVSEPSAKASNNMMGRGPDCMQYLAAVRFSQVPRAYSESLEHYPVLRCLAPETLTSF